MLAVENPDLRASFSHCLPEDLRAYCADCLQLCHSVWAQKQQDNLLLGWFAKQLEDRLQCFFLAQCPAEKLKQADDILELSRVLAWEDDPLYRQFGHVGEKLALGLKCFLRPNLDMTSERSLINLFGDGELKKTCEQATAAFYLAAEQAEKDRLFDDFRFAHDDIMRLSQKITMEVSQGNFREALNRAQEGLEIAASYIGENPLALKAHTFFSIVSFLLSNRVKGRLFGVAEQESQLGQNR